MKKNMKLKILIVLIALFILNNAIVLAVNTTGEKGIFTLNIPEGYEKINDDYKSYYEMETYDAEGTNTFFRVIVYDKEFFDLNLSGTMWFSYLLSTSKENLLGFSAGDLEKEANNIEKQDFKVTNKELLTINGYPSRRITAVEKSGYTTDVYQIVSNNYFAELYFYCETEQASKNFINSSTQKEILNSFKFNYDTASKCLNTPFEDISTSSWYYNAVRYVYENKIINGLNETTFAPNNKLTRGMMVTILYRMEGQPAVPSNAPTFGDVKDSKKYYYKAVRWAAANKIVSGYKNGNFGPADNITREQLAVILYKYAKYKEKDLSKTNDLSAFSDKAKVANYALPQVKWAVGSGVITGSNGKLNPKGNATRAEVAAMMEKYCKRVGR